MFGLAGLTKAKFFSSTHNENEAEVENLNGEWFSEMEKAIEDLLM